MRKIISSLVLFLVVSASKGQNVGIGTATPHPSAALDISDTAKGILIPRMTMNQRIAIQNPAEGLMVYQTDSTKGYWYFDALIWRNVNYVNSSLSGSIIGIPGISSYALIDNNLYYYGQAIASCSSITYNGNTDWRVPNQAEMTQLVMQFGNSIFPSDGAYYWTTTVISGINGPPNTNAVAPQPVALYVNGVDYNGNPIGPTFFQLNQYPYNGINPNKARVIYVR